jgi:two-component system LytT family response regulator
MIRAVIIDDEELARETISEMISVYCKDVEIVGESASVKSARKLIGEVQPDLLLLDIQLTDGTGFDLLKTMTHYAFKVIFITAYEDYALRAFKFSALDYLLKPIDPGELVDAVDRARTSLEESDMNVKIKALFSNMDSFSKEGKKIVLKTANNVHIVNLTDIIRCQSDKNYTHFYISNHESVVVSRTLKEYDEILSGYNFYRVHQSHLINLSHIKRYEKADGGYLVMSDESVVPVSFRKKEELMKLFNSL